MFRVLSARTVRLKSSAPAVIFPSCLRASPFHRYAQSTQIRQNSTSNTSFSTSVDIANILQKSRHRHAYELIQKDHRIKLPHSEYHSICSSVGMTNQESDELLQMLHEVGFLFYIPNSASDQVVIKPEEVHQAALACLDIDGNYMSGFLKDRTSQLDDLEKQRKPLEAIKSLLDKKAVKYADRFMKICFTGVFSMSLGIVRLTFWDLSWDIMEPVTYCINLVTMTAAISYFCLYREGYEYSSIRDQIIESRQRKYYKKHLKFDKDAYDELSVEIESLQQQLDNPQTAMLKWLTENGPKRAIKDVGDEKAEKADSS